MNDTGNFGIGASAGFDAEAIALIEAKQTKAVKQKLRQKFDAFQAEAMRRGPVETFEQNFIATIESVADTPIALYRFFQLYNFWNAGIASCIASLVSNIGQSYVELTDAAISQIHDAASYAFEVAGFVQQASTDEYGDPNHRDLITGEKLSHRVLASGLLKAVGNYAGLSPQQRNEKTLPAWLITNVRSIQTLYSGAARETTTLTRGIGMHIISEFSADQVEFSNACRSLFVKRKGTGFHCYLLENPIITVGSKTFLANSWLRTHGGWNEERNEIEHGVEHMHGVAGYHAGALLVGHAPAEAKLTVQNNIFEGITLGRQLLNEFFVCARIECEKIKGARQAIVPAGDAPERRLIACDS